MKIILSMVFVSIILNSVGQLLFKLGMNQIGVFDFSVTNIASLILKVLMSPALMGGLLLYFLSTGVWFLVLSRAEISYVYPLISLSYIVTAAGAYFFLQEHISATRLLGTLIIIVGVVLVCRS